MDNVVASQVHAEARTLATLPNAHLTLQRSPELVIKEAQQAAKQLANIVEQSKSFIVINGKKHLYFEAWQTIAAFHGITADVEWTKPLLSTDPDQHLLGFECRAFAHNPVTGTVLTHAEAECRFDEKNWKGRDKYALRSMVQTRAMAKALRNVMAWQVVLAGYKPTPAEEMEAIKAETEAPKPAGAAVKEAHTMDPLAMEINAWAHEMVGGDADKAGELMEKVTTYTSKAKGKNPGKTYPGKRDARELNAEVRTGKRMSQLQVVHGQFKKVYDEWKSKQKPVKTEQPKTEAEMLVV